MRNVVALARKTIASFAGRRPGRPATRAFVPVRYQAVGDLVINGDDI